MGKTIKELAEIGRQAYYRITQPYTDQWVNAARAICAENDAEMERLRKIEVWINGAFSIEDVEDGIFGLIDRAEKAEAALAAAREREKVLRGALEEIAEVTFDADERGSETELAINQLAIMALEVKP